MATSQNPDSCKSLPTVYRDHAAAEDLCVGHSVKKNRAIGRVQKLTELIPILIVVPDQRGEAKGQASRSKHITAQAEGARWCGHSPHTITHGLLNVTIGA